MGSVVEDPKMSLRRRVTELGVSKSILQKVFKENKLHPFKPKFVHTIEPMDDAFRLEFSTWVGENVMEDQFFHHKILFSDEASFTTNGYVSSQNCRYWAEENPNYRINRNNQRYKKVNVWCGILINKIIGPFFFENNLNQHNYLDILQNFVLPSLEDIDRDTVYFQQDGCPAHSTNLIKNWLDNHFPERWIGRFGPIHWPARSPDLTPMDFYFWGYVKQRVYENNNFEGNLEALKDKIRTVISEIDIRTLRNVYREFRNRVEKCVEVGGGYVE